MALQKSDILGHEARISLYVLVLSEPDESRLQFIGGVDRIWSEREESQTGASFQIACGQCEYCQQKLSSLCDRTNNSSCIASNYAFTVSFYQTTKLHVRST